MHVHCLETVKKRGIVQELTLCKLIAQDPCACLLLRLYVQFYCLATVSALLRIFEHNCCSGTMTVGQELRLLLRYCACCPGTMIVAQELLLLLRYYDYYSGTMTVPKYDCCPGTMYCCSGTMTVAKVL